MASGRKSEKYGRFFAPMAEQHGVMSLDQLREYGYAARAVQKRCDSGLLHRIHSGVYSIVPRELLTREAIWMAAVLACGREALLAYRSAAALEGLRDYGYSRVEVLVPGRSRGHHDGIFIHRSTTLTEADRTTVDGIPCTSVARTLLDLSTVVTRRGVELACDRAEQRTTFDLHAVRDVLARNPRRGRRLRAVLDSYAIGEDMTWSDTEALFRALVRAAGLPAPRVNEVIDLHDGDYLLRPDFCWPDQRLIVETDSRRFHGTALAFESDRHRDQRLTLAGWRVVRITQRQLIEDPAWVTALLTRLLQR
jgi:predicted transcriptional regulator of viral defense system/very-short-patch-repair endonuclease